MSDFYVIEPCQSANGIEIKLKGKKIDLGKAEAAFASLGEVVGSSAVVLLAKIEGFSVSAYGSGRMMVKSAGGKRPAGAKMERLGRKLVEALESRGAIK